MKNQLKKFDMTGKSVLITGGGTGLGYEMTKALAGSGAKVMIAARREDVLQVAAKQLTRELDCEPILVHRVDLLDRDSVKALADGAAAALNGVDVFIGNAGVESQQPIDLLTDEAVQQQIRGNLSANVELTRAFLPTMRKRQWGRIIYSSSIASEVAGADDLMSIYGATKAALNSFARYVAAEAGPDGITANTLVIGAFVTEMLKAHLGTLPAEMQQKLYETFTSLTFLRRPGRPDEMAGLVQLLASDAGSYITGTCIPIDGGITACFRPGEPRPR